MAGAKDAHNCAIALGLPYTIATMTRVSLSSKQQTSHIKRLYDLSRNYFETSRYFETRNFGITIHKSSKASCANETNIDISNSLLACFTSTTQHVKYKFDSQYGHLKVTIDTHQRELSTPPIYLTDIDSDTLADSKRDVFMLNAIASSNILSLFSKE